MSMLNKIADKGWIGVALIVALVLFLIVLLPFMTIWALNTLFGLSIAYTFTTWLATAWIGLMIGARR